MWLIDADVFLLELTHWKGTDGNYHENSQTFYTLDEVMDAIEEADVEAEPVKRGRWIYHDDDDMRYDDYHCSVCRKLFTVDAERIDDICFVIDDLKYCPNCGARMEEES